MDRQKDLDELAQVDRLIVDAERRLRDLEMTMRETGATSRDDAVKATDLLASLRLALVKYKARRAAIVQFIQDTESGRLYNGPGSNGRHRLAGTRPSRSNGPTGLAHYANPLPSITGAFAVRSRVAQVEFRTSRVEPDRQGRQVHHAMIDAC